MKKKEGKFKLIKRGFHRVCPICGERPLFSSYIKLVKRCKKCKTDFTKYSTDDGPAYCTIFIVGHVVIPSILLTEGLESPPPMLFQLIFWPLVTILISTLLLPRIKGAFLALQISVKDTVT
jgi:uncharacterized protein (DUF983 family)